MKSLVYTPAYMKKSILKPTGDEAGKSLENNISVPIKNIKSPTAIQKKIGQAITGKVGSLIESMDEILKSLKYKGYKQFCIDNIDRVNECFIECKKYDSKESFKELYDKYVDEYNNFYLNFRQSISNLKKDIIDIDSFIELYNLGDNINEGLKKYNVKNIKELKAEKETLDLYIEGLIDKVSTNKEFDESKFKLKFYQEYAYTGITIGINKFPKPINWSNYNSANDEDCFNEIKKNRGTHYDIQVEKEGEFLGYINNIVYETFGAGTKASKAEAENKNKILKEIAQFGDLVYSLIFNIACDDALITFNYTEFMQKLGRYEDITNLFRGNFSFYSLGGNTSAKYDSVIIPIDCFVPINLKQVYGEL